METIKLPIPTTAVGKSYWNNEGRYQSDYDKLYDLLVPAIGAAENLFGEVVRAASRLVYEYNNNGNCNACERTEIEGEWVECPYCHGLGTYYDDAYDEECECAECCGEGGYYEESECENKLNEFYGNFLNLLREFFQNEMPQAVVTVDAIENIILQADCCSFSETEERPYVMMMDAVIYIIKSKAASLDCAIKHSPELPEWYKETRNL